MLPPQSDETIPCSINNNSLDFPVILNTDTIFEASSSNIESEPSEVEIQSTDLSGKCQIIEIKDLFHCRKDNIIYFVSNNGKPCDDGALKLIENNKLESKQTLNYPNVTYTKRYNGYYYFSLCIREEDALSISKIKENIFKVFTDLRELVIKLNLKTFCISYSKEIEKLDWIEILNLLKLVFNQIPIKIVICKNSLQYVISEFRDKIFYELHDLPIGDLRGISKTYNRIKTILLGKFKRRHSKTNPTMS